MKSEYKSVKGMPDLLPESMDVWHFIESNIRNTMAAFGYSEIRLPIVEKTSLFKRSIGEVTDIVEKEMYTFVDRDKDQTSLTLRPEGTASCVRSVIENSLIRNNQQQRLWYLGPMYRRERPQKGRYRQFWQLGVEAFSMPSVDIEIEHIQIMQNLFNKLGVSHLVNLEINSLGGTESRSEYINHLKDYFTNNKELLDDDSKRRLDGNTLRILDSKNPDMQELIEKAPKLSEFLTEAERNHFEEVREALTALDIKYTVNSRLVRGLDYYQGLVYEWTTDALGSQGTVCAGGRYDGLIAQLGGSDGFGVGFALGVERLAHLVIDANVEFSKPQAAFLFAATDKVSSIDVQKIANRIRSNCKNLSVWTQFGHATLKNMLKKADRFGANYALMVGEDELKQDCVTVKFLTTDKEQQICKLDAIAKLLEA